MFWKLLDKSQGLLRKWFKFENNKVFEKKREDFENQRNGGDKKTILEHKVKAREKISNQEIESFMT